MNKKIYVIGHKSPDLDSVAAAIGYANYKNKKKKTNIYTPAVAGSINAETKFVLKKFGFKIPQILKNAKGKSLILVDHNEASQSVDGISEAKIIEILDHHKVDFKYSEPIEFKIKPWGASSSIIACMYGKSKIKLDKKIAGLMLAAILVDTVITKSPTCTNYDEKIIKDLAKIAGIKDWKKYGMEIFKIRSSVNKLSPEQIIKSDFKDFEFKAGKFGIGQVETVDLSEFNGLDDKLTAELERLKSSGNYHSVILFITDIINVGSRFLVATEDTMGIEKALGTKLGNGIAYIKGIISRKKQVAPKFSEIFDK